MARVFAGLAVDVAEPQQRVRHEVIPAPPGLDALPLLDRHGGEPDGLYEVAHPHVELTETRVGALDDVAPLRLQRQPERLLLEGERRAVEPHVCEVRADLGVEGPRDLGVGRGLQRHAEAP